ncbi:putative methyltransferase, YaeB/AF_0241 family [Desulfocapsa sulfexigens DSM 10523]|uniref:Putative methyltransferase, YaeB/AF_0241 family n=1 Tax=Desulfocapsa sulfexigens (strain DSM 10523 / SB164P1) TaxID=1167006 RepID=M1PCN3_DESSD|nr:tRNA (N6-threonylcarbamoyladenosine(37)-N6)-methyltransferase TrmO [Desulfocapsa sulfexigens]AGF77480.1 putative methyltransferase, YaeB/AF_0241 family [Desulfocapsa sulfexigens DSM 10523]
MEYTIKAIGLVHSCYREKFGIPRQPGLVKSGTGAIELLAPCDREEMFTELDTFSHIWLQFMFHEAIADGWRPTVRPPWLGGQKRVGLFASRTPHRPNFLGLSVVRYHGLRKEKGGLFLDISELDLLHGTPIVDIKPYVPYSDALEDATSGFVQFAKQKMAVQFSSEAEASCKRYQQEKNRNLKSLITEVLEQDPRPASQRGLQREYGMLLWDVNVRWMAEEKGFTVFLVIPIE